MLSRNQMKKSIAVFFLLICGLVVLLATIDLEPYLAPDKSTTPSTGSVVKEQIVIQLKETEPNDPAENNNPSTSLLEIFPEQEQVVTPITTKVDKIAEDVGLEKVSSSLNELEITILPVGEYPFSILLETFWEQDSAEKAVNFYQERGIPAYWVKVDLEEKGIRYRLFTGIFSTIPEAQQYLDQNQLIDKLIKPTYYSARIGVYTDKEQLTSAFVKTRQTGVIPYILGTKKGDYHLYVGSFYTYIGAIAQCRELTEAGLSCEPVKRSTIPPQLASGS